jgi:hypothetical protein
MSDVLRGSGEPPARRRRRQARRAAAAFCATFVMAPLAAVRADAPILRAELAAPAGSINHGAAIVETGSGALLACWYSGLHEEDRSVSILCARGFQDGARWSRPWIAVAPGDRAIGAWAPNKSVGNVTLTAGPGGRIWMIYGVIQSRVWPIIGETCRNWVCGRIDERFSGDEGATWSRARRLVDLPGALPRAELKPAGRVWLLPFYLEAEQRALIGVVDLAGAAPALQAVWPLADQGLIQPALVRQADGRFRVYFRDQRRRGVYTARFDPRSGWTGLELTNLPNPGSAVDAVSDGLGHYLLVYNPSRSSRSELTLARSADGVHFQRGCVLSRPGVEAAAAYPSVIRAHDGAWLAVYSADDDRRISFVRFTAGSLVKCFAN